MIRRPAFYAFLIICILAGCIEHVAAQNARALIDSERAGLGMADAKTLEKARSFMKRDSTYYVGYMYYGGYLFFRADDKLGFTKAIEPLTKALALMEKDFDSELKTRTNNYEVIVTVFKYQSDYGYLASLLETCYQDVEMPDKAFAVLNRVRHYNFQMEQNVTAYNTMAWIFHRNRVYTSKQFTFLKNSVRENVATANKYLDSALMKMQNDLPMNTGLFDPSFLNRQYLSTFHYKAMIYDYKLEIDSADYFYGEMIRQGQYSPNNYAEFKLAMGQLALADQYFKQAGEGEAPDDRRTREYFYMRGTLDTYRGHPEEGDTLLRKVLEQQGASPGYGWHSIGLARALHYEGLTTESADRTEKAARFQELHIGTTWGQEQYNLSVAALNYTNSINEKKEYFFENDQWWFWFNPVNWYYTIKFSLEIHHHKLLLASLIAENPEREQVIYTIFSSENLLSFDEVWAAIDGFGNEYFIKVYERLLETDKRPKLKKYFRYFLGKLYLAEGEKDVAAKYFADVIRDRDPDKEYNALLIARAFEGLSEASKGDAARDEYLVKFYENFPQLVPFSNRDMRFRLSASGTLADGKQEEIIDDMKATSIRFVTDASVPLATIHFTESKNTVDIQYSVEGINKPGIITEGTLRIEKENFFDAGRLLAWRLFNVQKTTPEKDEPVTPATTATPAKPAV